MDHNTYFIIMYFFIFIAKSLRRSFGKEVLQI